MRYDKTMDNGMQKKVTELYVVDAFTFAEAEATVINRMKVYISGEFEVKNLTPTVYNEIFFSDKELDDRWYKARLQFITIDEKTEKEKRSTVTYLVQAATVSGAIKSIEEVMGSTMIDYVIAGISETKIMDVFEHELKAKNADGQGHAEAKQ